MLAGVGLPESTAKIIHSIGSSADQLEAFAEDMLTIASIEANSEAFNLQDTSVADLVSSSLRDTFNAIRRTERRYPEVEYPYPANR